MAEHTNLDRNEYIMHVVSSLATNIRDLRIKRGLSQVELASMAGIHPSTVSNAESGGHTNMPFHIVIALCWALEVQPIELLGYVNRRPQISPTEFEVIQSLRRILGPMG